MKALLSNQTVKENELGVFQGALSRHRKGSCGLGILIWCVWMAVLSMETRVAAYPPAPHHLFYGMVRDELGNPVRGEDVEVIFETASGARLQSGLSFSYLPGTNYRLEVPMDAGVTAEAYKPTAQRPTVPFTMRVRVGGKILLPIELSGDYSKMGQPGKATRLDLTLGEDSDGDGLPDAWERQLIQSLDELVSLADVTGTDDADGDGLSNLEEYVSGNYAFDDEDGFSLEIKGASPNGILLEFLALRGRSYSVFASGDFEEWAKVSFELEEEGNGGVYQSYRSDDVRRVQVTVSSDQGAPQYRFFKLIVE